ncbi:hypothetical protein tloyanaT_03370 [Thalassotalea loyana]|uniref:FTR1 family iron permease n=1 Tax=Thalassotalea loyana TaxID=280483 RepID=A0ABQ6HBE5_9GAMM|nr:hypothetical protein [Thalassotalea loyana]GLX84085.1 hypothetical protein tloyanaT_03370 [Thalassotalea loyana]
MLINTVLLFIKDIFPIFVLLSFIVGATSNLRLTKVDLSFYIGGTIISVLLLYTQIENVGELFNGDGIEVFYCLVNTIVYISLLTITPILSSQSELNAVLRCLLVMALTLFTAIHLSEFFIYLSAMVSSNPTFISMFIGGFFGLGICLSFSMLLTIFLKSSFASISNLKHFFWVLYLAGFATQNVQLLQQIDVISTSNPLWDISNFVADASEYGYLLNTLIGYKAVPTVEYVVTYFASVMMAMMLLILSAKKLNRIFTPIVRNEK